MSADFIAARMKLAAAAVMVIEPLDVCDIPGGSCWHHVREVVGTLGGTFVYGWALGSPGPVNSSTTFVVPLYNRWVNHVLWRDSNGVLWEVTPFRNEIGRDTVWTPTHFIPDDDAQFEITSDEVCCPQPAVYVAVRPAGERAADCLCHAERAPREMQDHWVAQAMQSIEQAGFVAENWRLKRVGDMLRDILIVARPA
jgi:hypothetical protein